MAGRQKRHFYSVIQISGAHHVQWRDNVHVESPPIKTVLETQIQVLITVLPATILASYPDHI